MLQLVTNAINSGKMLNIICLKISRDKVKTEFWPSSKIQTFNLYNSESLAHKQFSIINFELTWLLITIIIPRLSNELSFFQVSNNSSILRTSFIIQYLNKMQEKLDTTPKLDWMQNNYCGRRYLVNNAIFYGFTRTKIFWAPNVSFNLLRCLSHMFCIEINLESR